MIKFGVQRDIAHRKFELSMKKSRLTSLNEHQFAHLVGFYFDTEQTDTIMINSQQSTISQESSCTSLFTRE